MPDLLPHHAAASNPSGESFVSHAHLHTRNIADARRHNGDALARST
jgi:hypothetical protein